MLSMAKLHPHNASKIVFLLTSVMDVYAFKTELGAGLCFVDLIIITCYIYIVLVWALKALYIEEGRGEGGVSSITTNVQHPPGWCDSSHSAPEHPLHTSLLVERRQSDEANQCMGMIRRPWWSEANVGNWIFNDHRESGPRFNVSSEGCRILQYSVPITKLRS